MNKGKVIDPQEEYLHHNYFAHNLLAHIGLFASLVGWMLQSSMNEGRNLRTKIGRGDYNSNSKS